MFIHFKKKKLTLQSPNTIQKPPFAKVVPTKKIVPWASKFVKVFDVAVCMC